MATKKTEDLRCIKECVFPKADGGAKSFIVGDIVKSEKEKALVAGSGNFVTAKKETENKGGK